MIENVEPKTTGEVQLAEIQQKLGDDYSSHHVGSAIKKLYPNITSKKTRNKFNWTKTTTLYRGISLISKSAHLNEDKLLNFYEIVNYGGADVFKIKNTDKEITMGYVNGYCVNGNRLISEITFREDKSYEIKLSGKKIDLPRLHLSTKFSLSEASIISTFKVLKTLRLCSGIPEEEVKCLSTLNTNSYVKENRSYSNDENSGNVIYRVKSCLQCIPFLSRVQHCEKCRKLMNGVAEMNDISGDKTNGDETLVLDEKDHEDMKIILNKVLSNCSKKAQTFLLSQSENLKLKPQGRRWRPDIIRLCLTLYCRSPRCYDDLRKSGFLCLPSSRLIQIYKNKYTQQAGIQKHILEWMRNEASVQNLSKEGFEGGLMIDEMSIQEDLAIKRKGNNFQLVGFVEGSNENFAMQKMMTNTDEIHLANHVLQLVFLGSSGFRFPFAHFPTKQSSASELYLIFWKAVKMLAVYGFVVRYVSMDGAQANRDFMKMLLLDTKTDSLKTMLVTNIFRPSLPKISIIMDYSHVMKKIRNNCCKSGLRSGHKRKLTHHSSLILWEHWVQAYNWDVLENPYPIHRKLTHDHFFLTSESKMRNHLAEEVLDKDMLHLMKCYRKSLCDDAKSEELNGTIELLENTSVMVGFFRDRRPIKNYGDDRLQNNRDVLLWFQKWESENKHNDDIKEKEKSLLSFQCREDITSLLIGFDEFCREKLTMSGGSIMPNRINSDVIENIFSQQRGLHNGCNNNPTYQNYCYSMNSIILGETPISRKSNTGGSAGSGCEPFYLKRKIDSSPKKILPKT